MAEMFKPACELSGFSCNIEFADISNSNTTRILKPKRDRHYTKINSPGPTLSLLKDPPASAKIVRSGNVCVVTAATLQVIPPVNAVDV
jgi:hypothetical protein